MFKQLDMVELITTKNIEYMSGPPNANISPHGQWSVVGNLGEELLLAKDLTIIRVLHTDVRKIADYDINKAIERKNDGKEENKDQATDRGQDPERRRS